MQQIKNMEFSGERPLFASHDLQLDNVVIHAGESALKECSNIIAVGCRFEGKYPFWHVDGFTIKNSLFTEGGRAAFPKSSDDGYTGGSPKDVSGDGRYQTGKRTTTQCSRNPLALPERGIDKCANRSC